MTESTITIQPAQIPGPADLVKPEYDVHRPLPYPYHLDEDGLVGSQDFWKGQPYSCVGFMFDPECTDPEQMILFDQVVKIDPTWQVLVGYHPVFRDEGGGMWNDTRSITGVSVHAVETKG